MHIIVHQRIAEINALAWNGMLSSNNPFMRHEFLHGLEQSGCVSANNGWEPVHLAVYGDPSLPATQMTSAEASKTDSPLRGVMPCYIKHHSYGEYIFDWSWADAHQRHGLEYYPKLSNAIPFTPAGGERWLLCTSLDQTQKNAVENALINGALALVDKYQLSSFHSLFLNKQQFQSLGDKEFLQRHSTQFHWQNRDYVDFDDFLGNMSSKKRKNIKRERRRVQETGIEYHWLTGDQLNQAAVDKMYRFYSRTIAYYGAQSYLNHAFYQHLADACADHTLFLFAKLGDEVIAGGLYLKSDDTLYGRYWGALDNFHSVHFETCYYQAIEWCINNGYRRFEAGAQGQHKLARGLESTLTYSAHWIAHPQFRDAIDGFLTEEKNHIEHYNQSMQQHSPFKDQQPGEIEL